MRTAMKNHMDAHRRLGNWLKVYRRTAGLTQAQLAERIGRQKSFVGKHESGRRLEIMEFLKIAHALDADPYWVVAACWFWIIAPSSVTIFQTRRPSPRYFSDTRYPLPYFFSNIVSIIRALCGGSEGTRYSPSKVPSVSPVQ